VACRSAREQPADPPDRGALAATATPLSSAWLLSRHRHQKAAPVSCFFRYGLVPERPGL
jgi:hypothetical protein